MMVTFRTQRNGVKSQREQYSILLAQARKRNEIIEAEGMLMTPERLKELREEYGPWEVKGLADQIVLFDESVERFDATIQTEQASVDELSEVLGLCRARDREIARLGERTTV